MGCCEGSPKTDPAKQLGFWLHEVRDSVIEVVKVLISQAKRTTSGPLLERYIGHGVILELIKGNNLLRYSGVLKDYTSGFIEIMDVDYNPGEDQPLQRADLVVPRKYGSVRYLGE